MKHHPEVIVAELNPLAGIEHEEFVAIEGSGLWARHKEFVVHFIRERDAAKAARLCGYAKPYHHSAGAIMERPAVRDLINSLLAARLRRLQVTPTRIEQELAKVAFASIGTFMRVQEDGTAYLNFADADEFDLASLKGFKCEMLPVGSGEDAHSVLKMEVQLHDKLGALDKLARIHRMIGAETEVTVAVDVAEEIRAARARARLQQEPVPTESIKTDA